MKRFSSRTHPSLGRSFLAERLQGAKSYDRIAGYFSSSILEVAGEELESVSGKVRVICNSELQPDDILSARAAKIAMRQEWCRTEPEEFSSKARPRFARLAELLRSGKLEVRVLPNSSFGLIHGKAGVIELADGRTTSFLGSANESRTAWEMNYELVWEDDSPDSIAWVREEFEALWNRHEAFPLAEAVIEDVERIAKRKVYRSLADWKEDEAKPASAIVETPVYRRQYGLWAHQKYFAKLAYDAHIGPFGARFVLADMVGLGKTIQLAMAALLMALWGKKPILIIAPKPLLWQWQDEMVGLLAMPSAVWDGKQWVDENGIAHGTAKGVDGILKCPRRVALVSQGLFSANTEAAARLKRLDYECIIVDEAHRARRRKMDLNSPEPNNLLGHLQDLAHRTRSLLLATATPVQIHPVEAWDLLHLLAINREHVLGNTVSSRWRRPEECLPFVTGERSLAEFESDEFWNWLRNPMPPADEGTDFTALRRSLNASDDQAVIKGDLLDELSPADRARMNRLKPDFAGKHSPFIRHIIRRTRDFLETEKDPETGEPYLDPVYIKLLGENDNQALELTSYQQDAYHLAEEFSAAIGRRAPSAGFLKTLLLRRAGSSVVAGIKTAQGMLDNWEAIEDEEESEAEGKPNREQFRTLDPVEKNLLESYLAALESNQAEDPKFFLVEKLLREGSPEAEGIPWRDLGCIIFSQYYDSAHWLAEKLSSGLLENEPLGLYAGSGRSALFEGGKSQPIARDKLKTMVREGEIKVLIGTDAASEGLNLQRLGSLINLDLPWNPTRLEQRKGRIQRIGQKRKTVFVYNLRYKDSVEDRVHQLLSERLKNIHDLFGQIPDTLEDAWIEIALGDEEKAKRTIGKVPEQHPFEAKYNQITQVDWETCEEVINPLVVKKALESGW